MKCRKERAWAADCSTVRGVLGKPQKVVKVQLRTESQLPLRLLEQDQMPGHFHPNVTLKGKRGDFQASRFLHTVDKQGSLLCRTFREL